MRAILLSMLLAHSVQALEIEHLNGVAQDSKEIMYFSSHEGVFRYDGEHTVNISKHSALPKGIAKDIEISDNDVAYILYSNGEIWSIELNTMQAAHFANSEALKIEVNEKSLYALSKEELSSYDIYSKAFENTLLNKKRIIDFDSAHGNSFALTEDGLYQITSNSIKQLIDLDVNKGEVLATPHGAVYIANSGISFYSLLQRKSITNNNIENASNLAFKEPYNIYYTTLDNINELTLPALTVTRQGINSDSGSYSELFSDSKGRIWAISSNDFTLVEDQVKATQLKLGSRYNVLFQHQDQDWLGTTNGVYQLVDNKAHEVEWLNNKITERKFSVTGFTFFSGRLIIATNIGLYQVDQLNQTVNKMADGYIINLNVENNSLYVSTNDHGLMVFNSNFNLLNYENINNSLPTKEVLTSKLLNQRLYIATSNGLVSVKDNEVRVLFQDDVMVTDVEKFQDNIYISTYGKGLFKYALDQWEPIQSPTHIKDLTLFENKLLATTGNGIHYLESDYKYTKLIKSTKQYSFTIGSLITRDKKIIAASDSAILEIEESKPVSPHTPAISFIETEAGHHFDHSKTLNVKDWVNIALTRVDYSNTPLYKFQYSLNNNEWLDLKTNMLQLTGLPGGEYKLKFREVSRDESSDAQTITFKVLTPWYKSKGALMLYVISLITLIALGCTFIYLWVQSFHRVFRKNQRQFQKDKISEAFLYLNAGKSLCGGNPTMVTEGLVKLEKSIQLLEPVAHCNASLGSNKLLSALDFLQIQTSLQTRVKVLFDINLGDIKLDKQLERDIYSVIYHGVQNSIEHSLGKQCCVYLYRCKNDIIINIEDDGIGFSFFKQLHFGVGFYTMKQIAKAYETKLKISSKNGTSLEITLPIKSKVAVKTKLEKAGEFDGAI